MTHTIDINTRAAGTLAPMAVLPSRYGIGDISSYMEFLDFLHKSGQRVAFMLPIGQTGLCGSPYSSHSSMGGSMFYISPELLYKDGLVTKSDCNKLSVSERSSDNRVHYDVLFKTRKPFLLKAYQKFKTKPGASRALENFLIENNFWCRDFALYMTIKELEGGKPWWEWSNPQLKAHRKNALNEFYAAHADEIEFFVFIQYEFNRQMIMLKEKAESLNILLAGDVPVYPDSDSSDCWAHRELFSINPDGSMTASAGVPADNFKDYERNWGLPLYEWDAHKKTDYLWWSSRMKWNAEYFDILRIDHAIALMKHYVIYSDSRPSEWKDSPFEELSRILDEIAETENVQIVCEDLGVIPDGLREGIAQHGWMQMRVALFACGSHYFGKDSHIFHAHTPDMTVFSSTHDTRPLFSHLNSKSDDELRYLCHVTNAEEGNRKALHSRIIAGCLNSSAKLCIFQLQDLVDLSAGEAISDDESYNKKWDWRMKKGSLSATSAEELRAMSVISNRIEHEHDDVVEALNILAKKVI